MVINNISLSKTDSYFLEETIVRHGRIVSFSQLENVFKNKYSTHQEVKNRISFLAKAGWLVRVKKGLYVIITDLSSLAFNNVSGIALTQALNHDSYISFENALQHYSMFDQMLVTVDAVTFKRARKYKVQNAEIRFFSIKRDLFFGFTAQRSDIGMVNIADKEKAILDMLYFRSNAYNTNLIWEKLTEYKNDLNFIIMKEHARKFGIGIVRKTGFLMDKLSIDTADLYSMVAGNKGYGRMSKEARQFNAKWRLYYDHRLID